jgi:Protein of unknown function (DUF664)
VTWADCTDDGPEWDIDADASMTAQSMTAWMREQWLADERIAQYDSLASIGAGNGRSVRWNLNRLVNMPRHNGHADLIRERIDGQTGK